jgi:branched-chain amino acid transport system permease protein
MKARVFQLASVTDVAWQMSGEVILMSLIGGIGTMFGPLLGAVIVVSIQNYFAGFGDWVQMIQGVIFVAIVLGLREGIAGAGKSISVRWRHRSKMPQAACVPVSAVQ